LFSYESGIYRLQLRGSQSIVERKQST
jgi:hypothetical protein